MAGEQAKSVGPVRWAREQIRALMEMICSIIVRVFPDPLKGEGRRMFVYGFKCEGQSLLGCERSALFAVQRSKQQKQCTL